MNTARLNLFESKKKNLTLSKAFLKYQRVVRNLAMFDDVDDKDFDEVQEKMKKQYLRLAQDVELDGEYIVEFDAIPDYETGYGHLNVNLLDKKKQLLIANEAISDGLIGEREIIFNPNKCYEITELGKKVLKDKIIRFKIKL